MKKSDSSAKTVLATSLIPDSKSSGAVFVEYPQNPIRFYLIAAVVTGVIGIYTGNLLLSSEYLTKSSWHSWTTNGYTSAELWGFIFSTFLIPMSVLFFWMFGYHSYKSNANASRTKLMTFSVLTGVFFVLLSFDVSVYPTDTLLDCGVWFCIFSEAVDNDSTQGFRNMLALLYLCICSIFLLMYGMLAIRTAWELSHGPKLQILEKAKDLESSAEGEKAPASMVDAQLAPKHASKTLKVMLILTTFVIFYPFIILLCLTLPDAWEYFTVYKVQSYASESLDNSWGKVWDYTWSDSVILKLYPDILVFYLFIYIVAMAGLVTQMSRHVEKLMHSCPKILRGMCVGEVLLISGFTGMMVYLLYYWYAVHIFAYESTVTPSEQMARTMGQLANAATGLLVLPVSRNNIWSATFGVSWEAMMKFHRWMGRVMLICVVLHVLFFVKYEGWGIMAFPYPDYHTDDFLIPMIVPITALMIVFLGIFSLDYVRRNYFEIFYYSHHFFLVVFLAMLWHSVSSWYYLIGGLSLWVLDRAIRFTRGVATAECLGIKVYGDVTEISYVIESGGKGPFAGENSKMKFQMGQYCFINIPCISMNEWHPYTISWAPSDKVTKHNIKAFAAGSFGDKLNKLAANLPEDTPLESLVINVDGPYGVQPDFYRYDHVTFICGGIGITPGHSCFRELYLQATNGGETTDSSIAQVDLVWSTRNAQDYKMFEETFRSVNANSAGGKFTYQIHVCGGGDKQPAYGDENDPIAQNLKFEMMNLGSIFSKIKEQETSPGNALLFYCGPPGLGKVVEKMTMEHGFDFHSETFIL